jgi:ethanolamine utilization protein EutJ
VAWAGRGHPHRPVTVDLAPAPAARRFLEAGVARYRAAATTWTGRLHCGVDLGTATVVLAIVDDAGEPVLLDSTHARVVREGVVVDFHGAVEVVLELRAAAERRLEAPVTEAAAGYPPGVGVAESRACRFVLEAAGFECTGLVDEVTAANALLQLSDAVVVDVGGGSTGVGVIAGGRLVAVGDLPGGGHHLDLILAGALHIPLEEAERLKRGRGTDYLHVLRPGIERVAANVARLSAGYESLPVHLVGGALMLPGAGEIVAGWLGRTVVEYDHALYITPFGIARGAP